MAGKRGRPGGSGSEPERPEPGTPISDDELTAALAELPGYLEEYARLDQPRPGSEAPAAGPAGADPTAADPAVGDRGDAADPPSAPGSRRRASAAGRGDQAAGGRGERAAAGRGARAARGRTDAPAKPGPAGREPARRTARKVKPPRRPDPEPLEVDDSVVIAVGTVAWGIAFLVLIALYGPLDDRGNEWWPWTALAGLGLGLWGWFLVRKRIAARAAASPGDPDAP